MSVYFAVSPTGIVKIGVSENPRKRLIGLRTQYRLPLQLAAVIDGDEETERKLHMRFGKYYSHGEWFFHKGELKKFLARQPRPDPSKFLVHQPGSYMSPEYIELKTIDLQKQHGWTKARARAKVLKDGPPILYSKQR